MDLGIGRAFVKVFFLDMARDLEPPARLSASGFDDARRRRADADCLDGASSLPSELGRGVRRRSRRMEFCMVKVLRSIPLAVLVLAVLVATMPGCVRAAAPDGPTAPVQRLHDTLLGVMRDADKLSVQERYQRLAPTLNDVYDFRMMTRLTTGSAWTSASEAERAALVEAFSRLSIATYAQRFSGFSGEQFEILEERPGPRETTLVDTRIVRPADDPVHITYVLQKQGEEWRIIDVILQGSISELAVRRSEYAQVLREGGPQRLSETLNAKADALLGS
ncbi:MAG: ABC transporter substrate-binding protein [Rhodospirillales bacterium]|nr:ABC transporter substrate-binding protein [Rhodospirillales bacterium]